jgi:hypothetical protein
MILQENWRKKLSKLKDKTRNKTKEIREDKRSKKKLSADIPVEDTPSFEDCNKPYERSPLTDKVVKKKRENKVNWFSVQQWFIKGINKNNPDWFVAKNKDQKEHNQTWWAWAEKNCAERLLKHYGPDTVEKTVEWFCDNWQSMVDDSNGKLSGAPNVRFLWAGRDRIFPDAVIGKKPKVKKHMVGEYNAEQTSKFPKIGW